jgi:hypothetical protein
MKFGILNVPCPSTLILTMPATYARQRRRKIQHKTDGKRPLGSVLLLFGANHELLANRS